MDNINCTILPGEKVGIVGRSGAGKTSFIKLLWRSLIPFEGELLMDGVNVNAVDLKQLRRSISIVSQEPVIFYGTLRENIDPALENTVPRYSSEFREREQNIIDLLLKLGFS